MFQIEKVRILIFGHKEFSQLMSSVLAEIPDQAECRIVDAIVGTIDEADKHVALFNPDVVISAGSNAAYLKYALKVPVLSLAVTEADIISAVVKAAAINTDIHLITYDNYQRLVSLLNQTTSLSITHTQYETSEEAKQSYHLSNFSSESVVVGASLVCGLALLDSVKSILIYSKESCLVTMRKAIEIGRKQREGIHSQAINRWLNEDSKTPILVVDDQTNGLTANAAANNEFAITPGNGQSILTMLQSSILSDVEDGECRINQKRWWFHKDIVQLTNRRFDVYQFYAQTPNIVVKNERQQEQKLICDSVVMQKLVERTDLYASSPSHILINGESGTGKEMIAKRIYEKSSFSNGHFVAINCAAMPSELFEGELFGYVEGAFTGSKRGGKHGLLYEAENGVLFLDEVSELSLPQQAKLLRVIQEKSYRPIGAHKEFKVNLKIIAATNKPLDQQVKQRLFRDDLYYRLNVLSIDVPSLRERRQDIPLITRAKLESLNFASLTHETLDQIATNIETIFSQYDWPGNIRELENIVERLLVYCNVYTDHSPKVLQSLLHDVAPELFTSLDMNVPGELAKNEYQLVMQAMNKFNGNKELVAQFLGISQTTLWRRLKRINDHNTRGQQHA